MTLRSLIPLVPLLLLATAALTLLRLWLRGGERRRLFGEAHGIGCSLSEEFGISVLCSGVSAPEQVAALLATEYTRLEVIVVLDARDRPEAFAALVARYRMIRVEWRGSTEFPNEGIRALWRSRRRSCRRFVLVDRQQGEAGLFRQRGGRREERTIRIGDWNAAAAVSAYDYLLPLEGGQTLLADAVPRLVAELGAVVPPRCGVRSLTGSRIRIVEREYAAAAGGFGAPIWRTLPRSRRITLWEPLACCSHHPQPLPEEGEFPVEHAVFDNRPPRPADGSRNPLQFPALAAAAALTATAAAAAAGWWIAAACCATAAVAAGVLLLARQSVLRASHGRCLHLSASPRRARRRRRRGESSFGR